MARPSGYSVVDHMILFHNNNQLYMWLEMRKSDIQGADFGVFTCLNLQNVEVDTVYCGEKVETTTTNTYCISNGTETLDCILLPDNKMYIVGFLANDPNWGKKKRNDKLCNPHFA